MPTITVEMVRVMNGHLEARGSNDWIAEREYADARYDKQLIAHPPDSEVAPLLIDEIRYSNCSSETQEVVASVDKTISNEIKWTLTFGTKIGWTISFEVNALFAKAKTDFEFEINFEVGREETAKEEVEYKFETPLKIPPMKKLTFQAIVQQEKVRDVPFTVTVFLLGGQVAIIPKGLRPLRRYYNGEDHFYTIWEEHPEDAGYTEEGKAGYIFENQAPNTVPLYRYYNGTDHFYTTEFSELGEGRDGWTREGVAGYVYPARQNGAVELYRYYNGTDHFYTIDPDELGGGRFGYAREGIAGFVLPPHVAESGNLRDITTLLTLQERTFTLNGTFRGESTVRKATILTLQDDLTAGQCDLLGSMLTPRALPAPGLPFYQEQTPASQLSRTTLLRLGASGVHMVGSSEGGGG
jgi:hypothetical protein